jgi:hypothetical protein
VDGVFVDALDGFGRALVRPSEFCWEVSPNFLDDGPKSRSRPGPRSPFPKRASAWRRRPARRCRCWSRA